MSNENNNNEARDSKTNISPNDQDNITTTNNDFKNPSNANSPDSNNKKELIVNLLSLDGKPSSKTILNESKLFTNVLDNETIKTDTTNKDLIKIGLKKKASRKKRKKGKKGKKSSEQPETESVLLTEVKLIPEKKKEESENHKFLRKKLENLNFSKNLQEGIDFGFNKANDEIKDDLVDNFNINEDKITEIEKLVPKSKINLKLNNKTGITYNMNKESVMRLKQLKNTEKYIKNELKKIEENQKLLDEELPLKDDIITMNNRKNYLKKIALTKNDLISKLKYNSIQISEIIDNNKTIDRTLLLKNYMSPDLRDKRSRNNILLDNMNNNRCYLSEDQEKYNKHLLQIQKEEKLHREKIKKDLLLSSEKKSKELELRENKKIERRKNYLEVLKNKEKNFLNQIKEKNNIILEKSNKYIDKKNHKKMKDYLFFQFQKKFENEEKKLIDKVNLMKKDTLVTKKELEELENKREQQKRILEEGLNEKKTKLMKMWKLRSQTLPVYKHPIVDMLEDEECDLLDEEEDKKEQKEKNEKEKRNYQPPKVKIDIKLKKIRESRNIKTNKDSVTKTEMNNKNRFLKNLDFMANIIEMAKEENKERNKSKIKIKLKKDKKVDAGIQNTFNKKAVMHKSIEVSENKIRHNYKLHPKPEKPIDYLKELTKQKKTTGNKIHIDIGVGDIFAGLKNGKNESGNNQITETLDMVKSKTNAIDRKVIEKKEFLKVKGGYINNTQLGDEVGNLLIESITTKLSLLNKLNGE